MNTSSSSTPATPTRASWRDWMDAEAPAQPAAWQILWTAVWAAGFALVFTLIGFVATARTVADWLDLGTWALWLGRNYGVSAAVSFVILALFSGIFKIFGRAWIGRMAGWQRSVFFTAVPLLGTAIGWPIGIVLIYGRLPLVAGLGSGTIVSIIVVCLLTSVLLHLYFSLRHKELTARMRANEAQLRLLQGQMEPHFLFNTLANVISLVESDAPRARHMLEALTDYLRASLGGLRHDDSTVAVELDLARRYLALMQTRMGDRLRFEIDDDKTLGGCRLMPLALQPLIENAVKHGLEPQVDGGTVRVRVTRTTLAGRDALQVCVEDDGAGLAMAARRPRRIVAGAADGHGIALANLRERLHARFGVAAQLTLTDLESGTGTRACLVVPWQPVAAAA